jgi:hypothetical protein
VFLLLTEQSQQLLGQEPVVESLITQKAIETRQGRAELHLGQAGELSGD